MARHNYMKISGNWKVIRVWVKVAGTWVADAIGWIKVGGTWQRCGDPPSLSLDKTNVYFGWDGTSCSGTINVTCNTIWTCVLDSEANFITNINNGAGNGYTTPSCNGTNETGSDYTTTLRFYIGTTEMASCLLTQFYYPNECN